MSRRWILVLLLVPVSAALAYMLRSTLPVTTSSRAAYEAYRVGREDMDKLYFTDALPHLQDAVRLDSNFALAHFQLSKCYRGLGDDSLAQLHMDRAVALSEKATEFERLLILSSDGRLPDSVRAAHMRELVAKYPDSPDALSQIGISYYSKGQTDSAIAVYERAIELNPADAMSYNMLGYQYAKKGMFPQAVVALKKYIHVAAGQANPHDSLGEIYMMMGRFDDAIAEFEQALAIKPDFSPSILHMARSHIALGRYDAAARDIERLFVLDRSMSYRRDAFTILASLYLIENRFVEALALADTLDREITELPIGTTIRGVAYVLMGDADDARAPLHKLDAFIDSTKAARPDAPGLRSFTLNAEYIRGGIARIEGDHAAAERHFRNAIAGAEKEQNSEEFVRMELAELLIKAGRPGEAAACLDTLTRRLPGLVIHRVVYAEALAAAGDTAAAVEQCDFVLSRDVDTTLAAPARLLRDKLTPPA